VAEVEPVAEAREDLGRDLGHGEGGAREEGGVRAESEGVE